MAYHVVDPTTLAATADHPCDRRSITEATGLATMAVTVYELAPGEQLSRFYHFHDRREEVFHVLAGDLHVETPEREFSVATGSVFVAEPESPIRPYNPAEATGPVRVFAAGAPRSDPGRAFDPD